MNNISFIKHADLSSNKLKDICELKSVAWPHSIESQLNWIKSNISDNDIHVILSDENVFLAYLNLININCVVDGEIVNGFGIGNVCSREQGLGYGSILMKAINNYLIENKMVGVLFCKSKLIEFYRKFDWSLVSKEKLSLAFNNDNIETMINNFENNFNLLEYSGKSF